MSLLFSLNKYLLVVMTIISLCKDNVLFCLYVWSSARGVCLREKSWKHFVEYREGGWDVYLFIYLLFNFFFYIHS